MSYPSTENVRLVADIVLFAQDAPGQPGNQFYVLLIKRRGNPHQGEWALPGGRVDDGETFGAAAYRELTEETGITLPAGTLERVDIYDDPNRDPRGRYISVAYTAVIDGMPEPIAADDAAEARWFPTATLPDLGLAFDHQAIICDAIESIR